MSQTVFGAQATVTFLNRAFNNTTPGNLLFQNQVAAAGTTRESQAEFARTFGNSFSSLSNEALAELVLTNMGVLPSTNDTVVAFKAELAAYLDGVVNADRGFVVLQLAEILTTLETATGTLAPYAAAAAAWNTEVTKSFEYSINPANTATIDPLTVDNTAPVVTAATFSYAENQVADAVVADVDATDAVGVTSFTIKSGNTDGYFAIGADGKITITAAGVAAGVNNFESGTNTTSLVVVAKDAAGNTSAETTIVLNETNVGELSTVSGTSTSVKLTFDSALKATTDVATSAFKVVDSTGANILVTSVNVSGSQVTLTLGTAAVGTTTVGYTAPATGGLQDAAGNVIPSLSGKTYTADATAPTLTSSTPADNAAAVAAADNIVLNFSEAVVLGTGNIVITNAADATDTRTIAVTDTTQVSLSADGKTVTVNPTADLKVGGAYSVAIAATAVKDLAGNAYAGIADATTLNFSVIATATPGSNFALTTAADNVVGTVGDDSIGGTNDATSTQFSSVDAIDGGAGIDTLKLQLPAAGYTGGAVVKNIEKIQVTGTAATAFDANGITGLTDVISIGAANTTAFNNVGSVANLAIQSNAAFAQTVQYANAAVAGAADAMTLTLNGAQNTINVDSVTADTSGVETINIVTTGNDSSTAVTVASNDTSVSKLTISGDKALTLVTGTNVTTTALTIDASALTGKLTLSGVGAVTNTITGGTNDDVVNFAANFTSADKFDGKAGVDTLAATFATLAAITTANANISNVETLMITDDVGGSTTTVNAALFGSINNFRVANQSGGGVSTVTVNGLTAAASGSNNIRLDGDLGGAGSTFNFNITNATDPSTANAATIDLRDTATGPVSTIVLAGVETVTIDTSKAGATQAYNLTDTSLASLTVKGIQGVTLSGAALGGNVSSIDASGLTAGAAGLAVTLSGTATTGASITGSALADTVTGSSMRDIANLGAGADTFAFSGGNDTVTLGAGSDIVRINTIATSSSATGANVVAITDFVAGTDKINFAQGALALTGVTTDGTGDAVAAMSAVLTNTTSVATVTDVYTQLGTQLAALTASAAAGTATVAQVVTFTTGAAAGSYLIVNDATAGFQAATDVVINITGVSGTVSAADFTFAV